MNRQRILVFVPMYNCAKQVPRVLSKIQDQLAPWAEEVLVVDNGSTDGSRGAAACSLMDMTIRGTLLQNAGNYHLGGSHKVAFAYAIDHGYDWIIVVHGDDQADPADLVPVLQNGLYRELDALLGSRFSAGSRRRGYPWHRTMGNRGLNALFSMVCGRKVEDLGSGLNLFRVPWLRHANWRVLADDLTFNVHLLLRLLHDRAVVRFMPISWSESDQVSNVRLVQQTLRTLGIACGYAWKGGAYLDRSHAMRNRGAYLSRQRFCNRTDAWESVVNWQDGVQPAFRAG
jgi:dolichol-phosphate mannosyltransferase